GHRPEEPHATAENTARSGASAPPTTRSDHSWQRLLAPPLNQPILASASNLMGPEPRRRFAFFGGREMRRTFSRFAVISIVTIAVSACSANHNSVYRYKGLSGNRDAIIL